MKNINTEFPKDFLWGSSTNAQQFEGGGSLGNKGKSISDVRGESAYMSHVGFEKRYCFIYVDKNDNLKRYKKDSFYWYTKVIKSNGNQL